MEKNKHPLFIEKTINKVCDWYKIDKSLIMSKKRDSELQLPKRIIYYILRNKYRLTIKYISKIFSVNHATIIHWLKVLDKDLNNEVIKNQLEYFLDL